LKYQASKITGRLRRTEIANKKGNNHNIKLKVDCFAIDFQGGDMKDFNALTVEEKATLTSDEIEDFIAIATMGIKKTSRPTEPTYDGINVGYNEMYQVNIQEPVFATLKEAEKYAKLLKSVSTRWEWGSDYPFINEHTNSIKTIEVFNKQDLNEYTTELRHNQDLKSDYDSKKYAWERYNEKMSTEINRIRKEVMDAKDKITERQKIIDTYNEYLELTDGDKEIAMKFLKVAFGEDVKIEE